MAEKTEAHQRPKPCQCWSFSIDVDESSGKADDISVPLSLVEAFRRDGFVRFDAPVLSKSAVHTLNQRLEEILRGRYSREGAPDKVPRRLRNEYEGSAHVNIDHPSSPENNGTNKSDKKKKVQKKPVVGPLGFSPAHNDRKRVLQIINANKCDHLFRKLACSPALGRVVAQLAGWQHEGVRLAQDQIWAKPPGAPPLAFHRDAPYFMFEPPYVVTVWLALDEMDEELGPLEYVKGSHLWGGNERTGSLGHFFQRDGGMNELRTAFDKRVSGDDFEIVSMAGLKQGALSIHDGRTWHGSSRNKSEFRPRRGFGIHFVPANVRFTEDAKFSRLWRPYVEKVLANGGDPSTVELPLEDFPITWQNT